MISLEVGFAGDVQVNLADAEFLCFARFPPAKPLGFVFHEHSCCLFVFYEL